MKLRADKVQGMPASFDEEFLSLFFNNIKFKMYKTVNLYVFFIRCQTWSHMLSEEHRLRVLENRGAEEDIWK
jgi:hypothetical protein